MQQACEHKAGVSYCPETCQCKEPSKAKVGESLRSQPWLDKSRGVSHVYTMSFSLNKKKRNKKGNWVEERYTPENSPMGHVQRSTERQGKKGSEKMINHWLKPTKEKICFKKKNWQWFSHFNVKRHEIVRTGPAMSVDGMTLHTGQKSKGR